MSASLRLLGAAAKSMPAEHWNPPGWVTALGSVVALLLGSSAFAAGLGALRSGAAQRRQEYTSAAKSLTSWAEYPYRIRRRTSDSPEALATLAAYGHDLQELLADRAAWCAAEHPLLGAVFEHLRGQLSAGVGPAISIAWGSPAIRSPGEMNLGTSFSVQAPAEKIRICFNECVHERFGPRRLLPGLHGRLKHHIAEHGLGTLP